MADLSDIGLRGLESYQTRVLQAAQSEQLTANAAQQRFETGMAQRRQQVADLAAASLSDPTVDITDPTSRGVQKLTSLADPLTNVGMIFAKSGLVEEGTKYLEKASEIRRREVQNINDEVVTQQNRLENIQKGAEAVGSWLGRAMNQEEWDYGLSQLETILPEETAQFRSMNDGKYSPDVAAFLREKAISVLDQTKLDMDEMKERGIQARHLASISNEDERIELQRARDAEDANYKRALIKAAGAKAGPSAAAPSEQAVNEARSALISGNYFKQSKNKNAELDDAANFIANEVTSLIRDTPGLSRNAAVQRAIMRADAAGKFKTEGEDSAGILGFGKSESKKTFNRYAGDIGKTQEAPAKLPPKGTKPAKGQWYTLPDGSIGQFDGSDFVIP